MMQKTRPVKVNNIEVGNGKFCIIAGPCSIESKEQLEIIASHTIKHKSSILRGGVFKLRTDPKSFQGLGKQALQFVKEVKHTMDRPFVAEITDPSQIDLLSEYVDLYQIGSRNMYNYDLLKALGRQNLPVLLKRGFSATIDEWLKAAEYIISGGNDQIILCERGIRGFDSKTRNVLDISSAVWVKQNSPFPVIVDPSHGTGIRELVSPMANAIAASGVDGMMVEVHPEPSKALSDGFQALDLEAYSEMVCSVEKVLGALGREISPC